MAAKVETKGHERVAKALPWTTPSSLRSIVGVVQLRLCPRSLRRSDPRPGWSPVDSCASARKGSKKKGIFVRFAFGSELWVSEEKGKVGYR